MNTSTAKSRKGFTLVEIMIVVAIIALLAAIAVPGSFAPGNDHRPAGSSTICA